MEAVVEAVRGALRASPGNAKRRHGALRAALARPALGPELPAHVVQKLETAIDKAQPGTFFFANVAYVLSNLCDRPALVAQARARTRLGSL